ncbi:hypothetical protein HQQ82_13530 [Rathayibacter sp. VKM Ac-2856]|uniref:hypothetical protein n=1 Tax=unclassified Rathayibacter TaxID=2609250 RepID=UPI001564D86D|nr:MULTISPECIES: hypothetical protein [unclassified Rathayibacter]NQX06050.1 hypothetical protein [Rathayibacter sp. VKM Ac-2858]NQX21000.1 hypothetical protein [Rathayibacter sp. VKM Ac-2856]
MPFDLEIVESGIPRAPKRATDWSRFLARDLRIPDAGFRDYLARVGAESPGGRNEMRVLTELHLMLHANPPAPELVGELIKSRYPLARDMRSLKREVFGRGASGRELTTQKWPESTRLTVALANPECLDYGDLEVGPRLATLIADGQEGRGVIDSAKVEAMSDDQIHSIVDGLVSGLEDKHAVVAAVGHDDLGLLIVSRRPTLLRYTEVWAGLEPEMLVSLFSAQSEVDQIEVIVSLAAAKSIDALSALIASDTSRWWRLLRVLSSDVNRENFIDHSMVLRGTLERVGVAALVGVPISETSDSEILLLLQAGDLSWGLWRRVNADRWISALAAESRFRSQFTDALDRLAAITLVTAAGSPKMDVRQEGWNKAFPYLHEALKRESFEKEAWGVLSTILPAGPAWDRCQRLRNGAVSEIRRDSWNPILAERLITAAQGFETEMRLRLEEVNRKKRRKNWLEEFLSRFA